MISCAAIATALISALSGDVIQTGPVKCPARIVINKATLTGVTLDATGATFLEGITIANSSGLTIRGGNYGTRERDTVATYAIQASNVTDFSVAHARFLAGPGGNRGGVQIRNGQRVTVRDSLFFGHRTGLSFYEVTDALAARNTFREATSDGINVVGSHRFVVAQNDCHWTVRVGNAHPDCIQLWSLPLKPLQSDGWIVNNKATGLMQGILSSDPKTGSATRLRFHGNYTAVMFSHTITCGACTDSVATDNVLSSYPGAFFGDLGGALKGTFTVAERNVRYNGKVTLPPRVWWYGAVPVAGSRFDRTAVMPGPGV